MATTRVGLETDLDKCISNLAETRARCLVHLKFGECRACECSGCDRKKWYDNAVQTLAPVDRINLENKTEQMYVEMMSTRIHLARQYPRGLDRRTLVGITTKIVVAFCLFMFVMFVLPLLIFSNAMDISGRADIPDKYNEQICKALTVTKKHLRDVNGDGKVNCIDYSVIFKIEYDKLTQSDWQCQIIQNINRHTGMNHLFIQVFMYNIGWVCIEPQGGAGCYLMDEFWGTRYNKAYNISTPVTSLYYKR